MLKFIIGILSEPAFLLGLIALIGLILQKKNFGDTVKGTMKTIIGFLILSGGAGLIVSSLLPFGDLFQQAFGVAGVLPNNEVVVSMSLVKYGSLTALVMIFGMLVNIFIARFSKFKFIFLTGHHILYMSCMITGILIAGGIKGISVIILGSISLGVIMVFSPAITYSTMTKITGMDDIALGHFGSIGYALSAKIGKIVGKNSKSSEEINLPKNLSFLRDSTIMIALFIGTLYIIVSVIAGPEYVAKFSQDKYYLVWAILQALTFAAGVAVVLQGVKILLNEIVPAFQGISEKLVPNSVPALDCPVIFSYAQNALLIGFVCSFIGGVLSMILLGELNMTMILPGTVVHFFAGGTSGIFGNATGGRRGAAVGSFIHGIFITFLAAGLVPVLSNLGFDNATFADGDFGFLGIILGHSLLFSKSTLYVVVALMFITPFALSLKKKKA